MPVSKTPSVFEICHASLEQLEKMGGKASTLAKLLQLSFPVPPGVSVLSESLSEAEWEFIFQWAKAKNVFPVAVRSSAQGEDGSEVSYAGQFKTFLNIGDQANLKKAVQDCFSSVEKESSKSYAAHFDREEIPMRVLIQKMIQPRFSGVYFSHDPRYHNDQDGSGWMIEAVEGLGEKLVSGQVTPYRFQQNKTPAPHTSTNWKTEYTQQISEWAKKVEVALGYQIDMEWAIDGDDHFWILQVRPITTGQPIADIQTVLKKELNRLRTSYANTTIWDGHSFAELSGVPSEFTYTLWRDAFLPERAFDLALRELGYKGVTSEQTDSSININLLDRVFGRSYLNLRSLEPVYFGNSPYKIVPSPRPHLEFDWRRLSPSMLLKAPQGFLQMIQVAWIIQTHRKELAQKAQECLNDGLYDRLSPHELYAQALNRSPELQLNYLENAVETFTKIQLYSTFLITLLIESTTQGLLALLSKDLGPEKAMEESHHFLGENLKTITSEMSTSLMEAHGSEEAWNGFVSRFGHRGLGELELSHPRWIETKAPLRRQSDSIKRQTIMTAADRKADILSKISAIRRPLFSQELEELQRLLQIREQIKMHVMKPYADIRWSLLALGKLLKNKITAQGNENIDDIFWLNLVEIKQLAANNPEALHQDWPGLIKERKELARIFKTVEIPMCFSAAELNEILNQKSTSSGHQMLGVSLSPGIASGLVHIVTNPESENLDSWPENTILVAEATDPGWTPLFGRAKAIIVARGGVLSHCAIVAREMGLPAVGEIYGASSLFKEGEHVWVDGIHGTVSRNNSPSSSSNNGRTH